MDRKRVEKTKRIEKVKSLALDAYMVICPFDMPVPCPKTASNIRIRHA
jgi:hypothetical protein